MKTAIALFLALACAFFSSSALAQNQFYIPSEGHGAYSSMLPVMPAYVDALVLAANVNESVTVPTGVIRVVFYTTCVNFYVRSGSTAAIPVADVADGTASIPNPIGFAIDGITSLGVISPAACVLALAFYK